MTAKRPLKTAEQGANDERKCTRAFIRRLIASKKQYFVEDVLEFINKRTERYNKRKGGLGR